ncbi:MAG: fumarylacetoacetate hydrolase family protein [Acidiferrobacterales bacterium]|nr:fumarylacetoacetate hydrolase family protein [Acidiferrobacterales bacterium]
MKLLRYGEPGGEKPGVLDSDDRIRDLSAHIDDIDGTTLSPESLSKLSALDLNQLPVVANNPRIGPCVSKPGKFVAIGLNYSDHAKETGSPIPDEPVVFYKADTSICGPNDNVIQPKGSTKLDWEIEIGIVIGSMARNITEAQAEACIAGYCIVNDVSERSFQIDRGGSQWSKGKGCDTFGPIGPWMVTKDDIDDVQNLDMWLNVNGERMQSGNTSTMIFQCHYLVSYLSDFMTLMPGDIITTGTPPGVGLGMTPPRWLQPGDVMELGIENLGNQKQTVVAFPD